MLHIRHSKFDRTSSQQTSFLPCQISDFQFKLSSTKLHKILKQLLNSVEVEKSNEFGTIKRGGQTRKRASGCLLPASAIEE